MFGLSLPKLLLTALVIGVVWYGFKAFSNRGPRVGRDTDDDPDARIDAEDMVACPVCGNYVAGSKATSCGRGDCPYPRK
jgi:uncharacterized protein